jgi:hypothetical protein
MTTPTDPYRKWVRLLSLAVIAIAFIPYLYGYLQTPPGMVYMGFADHPYDQNAYISYIQQASEGKIFIRRDHTLEYQRPLFFMPFNLILGRVARSLHLTPLVTYHIARAVYAYLLLMTIYWLTSFFTSDGRRRFFAFALCACSSGLCWVIPYHTWGALFKNYNLIPICYWVVETVLFEIILSSPHSLTTLFLILSFGLFLRALRGPFLSSSLLGGACVAVLALLHPVDVVTVYIVLSAYFVVLLIGFRGDAILCFRSGLLIFLLSLPVMLYQYYLFTTEPVFIEWSKEAFISPNPLSYVIGYGLVLFLAIPEIVRIARRGTREDWFLLVWAVSTMLLLYAPLSFQRRLSLGLHVPLCVLASGTVFRSMLPWARRFLDTRAKEAVFLVFILLLTVPSNLVKLAISCTEQRNSPLEFYLPRGDWEAMRWMRETHNEDAAVLSNYKSGLYIPAYTGNRSYVGHWSETIDFERKADIANWILYAPDRDELKKSILKRNGIDYIYFGSFERMRAPFAMKNAHFLETIYDRGGVQIYRFNPALP